MGMGMGVGGFGGGGGDGEGEEVVGMEGSQREMMVSI